MGITYKTHANARAATDEMQVLAKYVPIHSTN
jgi:hypothetical protein